MDKFIDKDRYYTHDLVLVGGGHAHIQVIKMFAMKPIGGVRVTLVTDQLKAPYSGMLPGVLGGWYGRDEAYFDLVRICARSGVRLIHEQCTGIDPENKKLLFSERPDLEFDALSINVGILPKFIEGQDQRFISVKPISTFFDRWNFMTQELRSRESNDETYQVAVIGGGPAGIELTFLVNRFLYEQGMKATIHLFEAVTKILPGHSSWAARWVTRVLYNRKIQVHRNAAISAHEGEGVLKLQNGRRFGPFDLIINASQATALPWLRSSGLAVDADGFMSVNQYLQSMNYPFIFGAGDTIDFNHEKLVKSGVYAVRQGSVLARNLRSYLTKSFPLKAFRPQKFTLSLITTGERYAIACYGAIALRGRWLWRIKDYIDRKFMRRWSEIPDMSDTKRLLVSAKKLENQGFHSINTCGACGGKVDANTLRSVLSDAGFHEFQKSDIQWDDSAIIESKPGQNILATIDALTAFCDDEYLVSRVAALHAVSDIIAMGGVPATALCHVTIPQNRPSLQRRDLRQIISGVRAGLDMYGVKLIGGHTSLGADLAVGLTVHGWVGENSQMISKTGVKSGDVLVLTKPLGTGAILAALGERYFKAEWWEELVSHLDQTHRGFCAALADFNVHAMTDVTGFGLAGHLYEMCGKQSVDVRLHLDQVPILDAFEQIQLHSSRASLTESNFDSVRPWLKSSKSCLDFTSASLSEVLFDPQTCGGMLVALPEEQAALLLERLHALGLVSSRIIGTIEESDEAGSLDWS